MTKSDGLFIVVHDRDLAAAEVRDFFGTRNRTGELWLARPDGRVCALLASGRGWMMWLRSDGDPGLSTRDPLYLGASDATLEFVLANGQVDRYPVSWTLPEETVASTLEQFAREGSMPAELSWHDNSANTQ